MNEDLKRIVVRSNAQFRYLNFLKEANYKMKNREHISFAELTGKYKVASNLATNLIDMKVIKKVALGDFRWIGNRPTLEMANELLKNHRDRILISKNKRKFKDAILENQNSQTSLVLQVNEIQPTLRKKRTKVQEAKPVELKQKTIKVSLFWGLIKFNKEC
jgi:hypothetical protein